MSESVKTNVGSVVIGNYGATPCVHRLPCGWCPFMSRTCPQLTAVYPTIPTTVSYATATTASNAVGIAVGGVTHDTD